MATIGIAGAGLMGRMIALRMAKAGNQVHLFDADDRGAAQSCTFASAGMLAPSCELESAERDIALLGKASLEKWPALLEQLGGDIFFAQQGSLVVAHPNDRAELERLRDRVRSKAPDPDVMKIMRNEEIGELEPTLAGRFADGLYFPCEGHVDNRDVLRALAVKLEEAGVAWSTGQGVDRMSAHELACQGETHNFDWVVDARGLGAKHELPDLRGVRGELIYVSAPEVQLHRPVRLMHPRYPIYIVPRANHTFVIGATALESEDRGPITVRSALELLSAAYTVHTGFAEGRLVETVTGCRPAFPSNRPRIYYGDGIVRVNGLYRHGFLISPMLCEFACNYMESGSIDARAGEVMIQEAA